MFSYQDNHRSFSTNIDDDNNQKTDNNNDEKNKIIWLYDRRNASSSASSSNSSSNITTRLRLMLGLATFHSCYWAWYVLDFVPAINASALDELHVEPWVGHVGLLVALFANICTTLYPQALIVQLGIRIPPLPRPTSSSSKHQRSLPQVCIVTYSVPTMMPAKRGVLYDWGEVRMEKKKMGGVTNNKNNNDNHHHNNNTPTTYAIKADGRRLPYLLSINHDDYNDENNNNENVAPPVIVDPIMLFQILLRPESIPQRDLEMRMTSLSRNGPTNGPGKQRKSTIASRSSSSSSSPRRKQGSKGRRSKNSVGGGRRTSGRKLK